MEPNHNMYIRFIDLAAPEAISYILSDAGSAGYADYLVEHCAGEVAVDEETQEIVGYVFVKQDEQKGFIFNLFVDEAYRGAHIGTRLLDDAIHLYGGNDLVVDKDNAIAIRMYRRLGFQTVSKDDERYWMVKDMGRIEGMKEKDESE